MGLDLLGKVLAWRSPKWWEWALNAESCAAWGCLCLLRAHPNGPMTNQTYWLNSWYSYCWKYHCKNSLLQPEPKFSVHSYLFLCSGFNLNSEYSRTPVQKRVDCAFSKSSSWVTKSVVFPCCSIVQGLEVAVQRISQNNDLGLQARRFFEGLFELLEDFACFLCFKP